MKGLTCVFISNYNVATKNQCNFTPFDYLTHFVVKKINKTIIMDQVNRIRGMIKPFAGWLLWTLFLLRENLTAAVTIFFRQKKVFWKMTPNVKEKAILKHLRNPSYEVINIVREDWGTFLASVHTSFYLTYRIMRQLQSVPGTLKLNEVRWLFSCHIWPLLKQVVFFR